MTLHDNVPSYLVGSRILEAPLSSPLGAQGSASWTRQTRAEHVQQCKGPVQEQDGSISR